MRVRPVATSDRRENARPAQRDGTDDTVRGGGVIGRKTIRFAANTRGRAITPERDSYRLRRAKRLITLRAVSGIFGLISTRRVVGVCDANESRFALERDRVFRRRSRPGCTTLENSGRLRYELQRMLTRKKKHQIPRPTRLV